LLMPSADYRAVGANTKPEEGHGLKSVDENQDFGGLVPEGRLNLAHV